MGGSESKVGVQGCPYHSGYEKGREEKQGGCQWTRVLGGHAYKVDTCTQASRALSLVSVVPQGDDGLVYKTSSLNFNSNKEGVTNVPGVFLQSKNPRLFAAQRRIRFAGGKVFAKTGDKVRDLLNLSALQR